MSKGRSDGVVTAFLPHNTPAKENLQPLTFLKRTDLKKHFSGIDRLIFDQQSSEIRLIGCGVAPAVIRRGAGAHSESHLCRPGS